jgi:hypothetical protein
MCARLQPWEPEAEGEAEGEAEVEGEGEAEGEGEGEGEGEQASPSPEASPGPLPTSRRRRAFAPPEAPKVLLHVALGWAALGDVAADHLGAAVEQGVVDLIQPSERNHARVTVTVGESAVAMLTLGAGADAAATTRDVEHGLCAGTSSCAVGSIVETSRRRPLESTLTTTVSRTFEAASASETIADVLVAAAPGARAAASTRTTSLFAMVHEDAFEQHLLGPAAHAALAASVASRLAVDTQAVTVGPRSLGEPPLPPPLPPSAQPVPSAAELAAAADAFLKPGRGNGYAPTGDVLSNPPAPEPQPEEGENTAGAELELERRRVAQPGGIPEWLLESGPTGPLHWFAGRHLAEPQSELPEPSPHLSSLPEEVRRPPSHAPQPLLLATPRVLLAQPRSFRRCCATCSSFSLL